MHNQRKIGAGLSYLAQFIHIFVSLVYTPVMLRLVGQTEYGLYQMVYSVVSYLTLMNFGFHAAYIRFYSRYKVQEDRQRIASLNGMFLIVFSCIAVAAGIAGGILVSRIESVLGGKLTVEEMETARILMTLMVINLVITFPISVFDCYVVSQEAFIFQKMLVVLQQILSPLVTLPFLLLGYGSVAIICVTTVLTFLKLAVNIYYCIVKLRMQFCFCGLRFSLLREMSAFTFFIFINQIIDQVNWSVDKFLLGRYVGTAAVAMYSLAGTINNIYLHCSTSISNVYIPKINVLVAEGNSDRKLTELFTRVGRIQFMILALILIGFVSIGKPFMCLWGGPEYEQSYYTALFLIVPVTIPLIQNAGIEIQRAKNMHRIRSVIYFLIAVGNVLLSIVLIQWFGTIGAAMGTAVALLLGNGLFMNFYYHKKIGLDMRFFWKRILSMVPSLLLPCGCGAAIMLAVQITSWLQWAACGCCIVLVYCISMYLWGLNSDEKEQVYSVLRRVKRKGREM